MVPGLVDFGSGSGEGSGAGSGAGSGVGSGVIIGSSLTSSTLPFPVIVEYKLSNENGDDLVSVGGACGSGACGSGAGGSGKIGTESCFVNFTMDESVFSLVGV